MLSDAVARQIVSRWAIRLSSREFDVEMQDLVLVSVDDHLVEPPDLFDKHIPPSASRVGIIPTSTW